MAPRPAWWHTLQEARRQACLAIDFYNRPGDKRSLNDFIVHMHLAWQNLLHADLLRRKVDIYHRDPRGRFVRTKDGDRRTWDLQACLKHEFKENDPVRINAEFFIGLRNRVEHRYQDAILVATAPHAHAWVINFEHELVDRFGAVASLAAELRFPVFVQSLTPEGLDEQRALRRAMPATTRTYITAFEGRLDPTVREDERFVYRVQLTPVKGPKSEADLAVTFVREDDLNPEEKAEMKRLSKTGRVLVTEKQRDVALLDELLPAQATAAIRERIPFELNVNQFTQLRKIHGVRPGAGQPKTSCDTRYCLYSPPFNAYVYTQAYVDRCVAELDTAEKFEAILGTPPKRKVTELAATRAARADRGSSATHTA